MTQPPFPDCDPEAPYQPPYAVRRAWPADWVRPDTELQMPMVVAYRCDFHLQRSERIRLHLSADERYDLWLDGTRIGEGPERCVPASWAFESYELNLDRGAHVLEARVWSLGAAAPWPQTRVAHGWLCAAEGEAHRPLLSTGSAPWHWRLCAAWSTVTIGKQLGGGGGHGFAFDASMVDGDWRAVAVGENATGPGGTYVGRNRHLLRPARLPAQEQAPLTGVRVVHVDAAEPHARLSTEAGFTRLLADWQQLLDSQTSVRIEPGQHLRVVLDCGRYACYRPRLQAGGAGGRIGLVYAEAPFVDPTDLPDGKECRDHITDAWLLGLRDVFLTAASSIFEPLWWRAGRFLLLEIQASDEPLIIDSLQLIRTGYPLRISANLGEGPDQDLWQACITTLRACLHETYMDCPYYEQLQYIGDTRIQALCGYVLSPDDRPQRSALQHAAQSAINPAGIPTSNAPSMGGQIIPTFSLLAIGMLHDFLYWRGDTSELRPLLPTMRATLERYLLARDADGVPRSLPGWNYIDAEGPGMRHGELPGGEAGGRSAAVGWLLSGSLAQAAELEAACGEPEMAARWQRLAQETAAILQARYWRADAGYFQATLDDDTDIPHIQILAVLSDLLPLDQEQALAARCCAQAVDAPVGIMFSHYLFAVAARCGGMAQVRPLWQRWRQALAAGFTSFPEQWGRTRSDCHAWSAHPIYHYCTGVAGIQPAAPGFAVIRIRPQPDPGERISVSMPHPAGSIELDLQESDGALTGSISLPVPGRLVWTGAERALPAGTTQL